MLGYVAINKGVNFMFSETIERTKVNSNVKSIKKEHIYLFIKRVIDLLVSGISLIILSPILLIVALLIKLDSKGPVFIDQYRIGKEGKLFKIYKFRSMVDNADEVLKRLMEEDEEFREEYTKYKKCVNDPRITRVGKIIRKTSLDELPQLLNIVKGDMSLVGPRPYLEREIDDMGCSYKTIIKVTPGLTGLWQVSGRNNTSFKKRCMIDVQYYVKRSLELDIKIIFKTFKAVFSKIGAK